MPGIKALLLSSKYYGILCLILFSCPCSFSQDYYIPLSREAERRYEPFIYALHSTMHTAVKPFMSNELRKSSPFDSLNAVTVPGKKFFKTLAGRKIFSEHLFEVKGEDYNLYLDPDINFSVGQDIENDELLFDNARGIWVSGNIGERFSFSGEIIEIQSKFPAYVDSAIGSKKVRIVPGMGRAKFLNNNYDYNMPVGTISFSLKKYFNFQFGHGKNFFGDGYRSLLLSDVVSSYPFLKINTTIWKIKYTNLYAVFQDMSYRNDIEENFVRKYGSFHFLNVNIGKRFSIGVFEAVIWKNDSIRATGFDINYINPFVFFRPAEFSIGSPDNAVLGANGKIKITNNLTVYGQLMLDEFLIEEVRAGNGWWGNKQAFQGGIKFFNPFGVQNLHLQTELNYVRPFTYQHRSTLTNYGHNNQPLAHPLGANFYESVNFVSYQYKRITSEAKIIYAVFGSDTATANYGGNVFKDYLTRSKEYGNEVGQGVKNTLMFGELKLGYIFNPKYNLKAELSFINRSQENIFDTRQNFVVLFGIKTNLSNKYFDF